MELEIYNKMSDNKNTASLNKLVASHYLASAVCFLVLAVMLLFSSDVFSGHYFQPRLLAVTHMAALGWGTLMIFGVSYQLLQFILETDLYSQRLAWLTYVLFLPGLAALVASFWVFDPGVYMQMGSILLLASVLLFTINIYCTVQKNKKESIKEDFIITSCWWLAFTAVLGTLLVFNFRFAFLPKDHIHFLRLHAHMGVAGWFLLLIMGVSSKLVPMFLASDYQNNRLLTWSYYLINLALLLFLVDTYISGINLKTLAIVLIGAAGIGSYLVYLYKCVSSRMRRAIDLPMIQTLFSFILLASAVIVLPFLIYYHLKSDPLAVRYSVLYGALLFMGWISSLILGQTFKTLPFIVWVKHYEHLTGKINTPLLADLIRTTSFKIQSIAFIIFCLTFYIGYFCLSQILINIGLLSLLVTAVFYLANVASVLLHKKKNRNRDGLDQAK